MRQATGDYQNIVSDQMCLVDCSLNEHPYLSDPSRAFVLVVYALSPDQLSAALWAWTYTQFSNGDPISCEYMRTQIRQIMKDTKRAEKYMYTVNKDQNDS